MFRRVDMLTEREVARITGISVRSLQHKRSQGEGPPFVRIGRSVRYPREDLVHWYKSLTRHGESGEG